MPGVTIAQNILNTNEAVAKESQQLLARIDLMKTELIPPLDETALALEQTRVDTIHKAFISSDAGTPCNSQARFLSWNNQGKSVIGEQEHASILETAQLLAQGAILTIKGLSGYHLACDALNASAVRSLRRQMRREAKPFALLVPDLATARRLVQANRAEEMLLESRQRPIVLLARRADCPAVPEVASASNMLGVMLPYSPLHQLLLRACASIGGPERLIALVMTSGDLRDEPVA